MYDDVEALDTVVVAIAQEDTTLADHGKFLKGFEPGPRFEILADLERAETKAYDRTTAYLVDKEGIVRQIFPMIIHARPAWEAILGEIDGLDEPGK